MKSIKCSICKSYFTPLRWNGNTCREECRRLRRNIMHARWRRAKYARDLKWRKERYQHAYASFKARIEANKTFAAHVRKRKRSYESRLRKQAG
jgi:hypothetical protein